jgi:hypothetical protein
VVYFRAAVTILLIAGFPASAQSAQTASVTRPIRVAGWVMAKYLTHEVHPVLGNEVNELVSYAVTISRDGNVTAVNPTVARAERQHPEVVDAIRQCKYRPYEVRGVPVEVQTVVTIEIRDGTGWPQSTQKPEPFSTFP